MNKEIEYDEYDFVEVDASDKEELRKAEAAGFFINGVRRDLRADHPTFIKLRRKQETA